MFHIFTLGTNISSWRPLAEANLGNLPFDFFFYCTFARSVCFHGAIHWMHERKNKFRVIPVPDCCMDFTIEGIAELGGCMTVYGNKC
ncbi:unnamed protein product [Malus baccata var. baccata]